MLGCVSTVSLNPDGSQSIFIKVEIRLEMRIPLAYLTNYEQTNLLTRSSVQWNLSVRCTTNQKNKETLICLQQVTQHAGSHGVVSAASRAEACVYLHE